MVPHVSGKGKKRLGYAPACVALAFSAMLAGCSVWNLGPQPSNYVGGSKSGEPHPLTDSGLQAVLPEVPGDKPGGGAELPAATIPATMPGAVPAMSVPPEGTPATLPSVNLPATTVPATAPATQPVAATQPSEPLSVQEAILTGLENNIGLRVQRYSVPLARTQEEQALSAFDPDVSGTLQGGRQSTSVLPGTPTSTVDSISGNIQIQEVLPTGTTITAAATTSNQFYSESFLTQGATLTVDQALLRGAGLKVNLAKLREAELATKISQYDLRGVAESLVGTIETDYWNLAFDERKVAIVENALRVAQEQLDSTDQSIRVGRVAETERAAQLAQVASERETLIDANSQLEKDRLTFLQAITPSSRQFWDRQIALTTLPFIPPGKMDAVDDHVAVAMRLRPDLNETRLQIQSDTLEVVRTKNGLLPELDMFVTLGKSSFASNFERSFSDLNGPDYSAMVGVKGDWSPINRAANASYHAARLTKEEEQESLANMTQLAQLDVRNQYIEVMRTLAQIPATRATREADEVSLTVEQQKFVQGRSTSLLVAQAQQNLLNDQLNEVQAVTNHLSALVLLYQDEGSLLLRRGLEAPGAGPPADQAWKK